MKHFTKQLLLLILFSKIASAQFSSLKLEHFTINDGLSNNSINSILQTAEGYLWIATKDGLSRYDGQNFKNFKHNPLDPTSIPENYIMTLLEGRDQTLWVGTWGGGLCKYDPIHESFAQIENSSDNYIQCLIEDHSGNIWYGTTTNGLFKYDPKNKQLTSYKDNPGLSKKFRDVNITALTEDHNNNLWIGTWDKGLIKFNPVTEIFFYFSHEPGNKNSISNNSIWSVEITDNHFILVSTNSGLDKININSHSLIHFASPSPAQNDFFSTAIRCTLRDTKGRIWIGNFDYYGLLLVEQDRAGKKNYTHLRKQNDDPSSLVCERIRNLYEDKRGNIWIGTEDGLNKLPTFKSFTQYRYMPLRKNSIGGRVVSNILEERDGLLWIGYNGGGFDCIDLKTNIRTHYRAEPQNKNSLSADDVIALYEDKNGVIWIGTGNGGLNRFDKRTKTFKRFLFDANNPYGIKANWVQQILETQDGLFLVGTNDALQIFDRVKEKFYPFNPVTADNSIKFPDTVSINSLFEDSKKNLWIGTWLSGLFRYDQNSKKLFHYLPDKKFNSISSNKITSIIEDSKGFIWIGTHSGGLNKFDKQTGKFIHFTTLNGLPNDVVFGILEDNKENFWISTMKGLARYNPSKNLYRVYDEKDGIVHNQFNWHAYHKNKSGKMYFGGIDGFVSFYPDSIKMETNASPVVLTSFKVFDKEAALPRSLPKTNEIVFEYYQNFFSIEFVALDLQPLEKHQFAYKLEGIDPDWVQAGIRNTAFYTDIRHGEYRFTVKACNADGIWGAPVPLKIIIIPAWWNTIWFRLFIFSALAAIAVALYKYRMNQLLQIERIRLNIAGDLHDEVGSNLSSISVDSQSLMKSTTLSKTELELSTNIGKTVKETIESFRDIIWFINPKNDFGDDLIFKMRETAAKLLSNIDWSFNVPDHVRLDIFNLEVRRNIFLLYKEAVTNVIRHSDASKCTIDLYGNQKDFSMIIHDNGKGFDTVNAGSNYGLVNMKRRAEKINALLNIISEESTGTRIEFCMNYQSKKSYKKI